MESVRDLARWRAMGQSENIEVVTDSVEETLEVARTLSRELDEGAVVLLYGELGAGKTVFAQGLSDARGIAARQVQSPTYTLVHEYGGDQQQGPLVIHVDLYRVDADEIESLGLEELFATPALKIVEWADRLTWQPEGSCRVRIERISGDQRKINIDETCEPVKLAN